MKKYTLPIILYIALGLVLSNLFGFSYQSIGDEWLPTYWANPIVYKKQGVTSLENYYSVYGVIVNVLIWSVILFFIDKVVKQVKYPSIFYKIGVIFLLVLASVFILVNGCFVGDGFSTEQNYWHWNIDQEAKDWGGEYGVFFR
ncbi:hypothetical protein [Phocoenobacter skyensis]|uniref:Uncharacterized protein n=1 Tax=Phocoenobacter skyensis TaxID=97481 RepID=A0A1H7YUE1_9PAST|nr:hypothetical protein [Pasteurella skyensis]MDP8079995.1 hypothetical protein [Pasteurella skyensis]MDP8085985.1 hypothetical protein [Pasteurella skyensis]MDP8185513.1 hypothetical protein [Pasteurella skyensis]QLB22428.1 hypothetical protein A6B44_04115 [Pasteurella skyensis]SEM48998.1 hypothetical protein SAMN05444853_12029 [Pasteurella skyensis]